MLLAALVACAAKSRAPSTTPSPAASDARATPGLFLYEVRGRGKSIHLLGTIHMGFGFEEVLTEDARARFQQASRVMTEADVGAADPQRLIRAALLPPEQSLAIIVGDINLPGGVLTGATADMAFALLLAVARRLREGDELVRSGNWTGWQPLQLLGAQVSGATLGIVGLGRIGRAVARRARGFDMTVLYHNRNRDGDAESDLGVRYVSLDELLELSDFVSLHAPLTKETRHMLAAAELRRMKPSAVLINTARGAVVDEAALVEALRDGTIAGAGLDVFEEEPAVHPGLAPLPNVVLAPHLGSATLETRTEMALLCSRAVLDVLAGRQPPNAIRA